MHNNPQPASPIFAKFIARQIPNALFSWAFQTSKCLIKQTRRFITVTPPIFASQVLYDTENKSFFTVRMRDWIDYGAVLQIFSHHDYNLRKLKRHSDISGFYKKLVQEGKTPLILDCGGHIGLASRYFADTYPEAKIICIEPQHDNFLLARLNNENKNVVLREAAIGSTESRGRLKDNTRGSSAFQVSRDDDGSLEIISIDYLLKQYASENVVPFIIKIDIEGFEKDLFSQNTDWVSKFPVLITELHDWMMPRQANSLNFLSVISKQNRDFVYFGENIFSISNELI